MPIEIIVDCGLTLEGGHHLTHLRSTMAADGPARISCVLTNRNVDIETLDGVPVRAVFGATGYEEFSNPLDNAEPERKQARAAIHAIALGLLQQDDMLAGAGTVRVLNATDNVVQGLALWLQLRGRCFGTPLEVQMLTGVGVGLRRFGSRLWNVEVDAPRRAALHSAFSRIAEAAPRLVVRASSRLRARELAVVTDRVGAPYALVTGASVNPVHPHRQGVPQVLLYAGDAKPEKGLGVLPHVMEKLAGLLPELRFAAHVNDPAGRFGPLTRRLTGLAGRYSNVTCHFGLLSEHLYRAVLEDSQAVVLLHTVRGYHDMESGLATEALSAGLPILCRKGTLAARMMQLGGNAQFCFTRTHELPGLLARLLELPATGMPGGFSADGSRAE